METYCCFGKIIREKGLQGSLIVSIKPPLQDLIIKISSLFIEIKPTSFIPYFIEQKQIINQFQYQLFLKGISTKEQAINFIHKEIFVLQETYNQFIHIPTDKNWLGYKIIFQQKIIGIVENIIIQKFQTLVVTEINYKEVLIPIHNNSIIQINNQKKELEIDIPDGLLEIYLQ